MRVPDKGELKRFCEIDGWEEANPNSPDHHRYKKTLANGEILRTRVSHGRGPACGDPALWHRIWRHQLGLESETEFWETLQTGNPPARGAPELESPRDPSMPTWLADYLMHRMGHTEDEVLELSEDEAMERYMEHIQTHGEGLA